MDPLLGRTTTIFYYVESQRRIKRVIDNELIDV
jgi:hypothetical protein